MSLQIWLPLTGDLHNQGLTSVTTTVSGSTSFNTSGKIGKSLTCNGSSFWIINPITLSNAKASICCWAQTSTKNKMVWVIEANSSDRLNLLQYEGVYYLNTGDSTQNPFVNNGTNVTAFTDGKWHHLAVTFGDNVCKLYKDGIYAGSATTFKSPATSSTNRIKVGGGYNNAHSYDWNGSINDFRIYDHALSPKEVEEIAKGLVLHYKLDDRFCEPTTNILTAAKSCANPTTISIGQYSGTLQSSQTIGNKIITYSAYIKNTSSVNTSVRLSPIKSSDNSSYGTYYGNWINSGEEGWSSITFDMTDSSTWNGKAHLYFANGSAGTTPSSPNIIVQYAQVEEKNHQTPWVLGGTSRTPTTIYDSSGYSNNGTIVGSLTAAAGSPRYGTATHIDETCPYIDSNNNFSFLNESPFTISIWVYCGDWAAATASGGKYIIYNYHPTNGGFQIYSSSGTNRYRMQWIDTRGRVRTTDFSSSNALTSGWAFFTATYDGTTIKTYLNGNYYTSRTNSFKSTASAPNLLVGSAVPVLGNYSDFRIYTTALTAAQVKELYTTSMSVDASGNIHARELSEL